MSNHEERLDRYIDDLNAGRANGSSANDPELAALFETVGQLHALRESHVPAALAAGLSRQLQRSNVPASLIGHPERSGAESNGSFDYPTSWTRPVYSIQDDIVETPPDRWFREAAQFAGAALAFTLFGLALVLVFGGTEDGGPQPAAAPPPVGQIAFVGSTDGNDDIYLINADGSDLVNLTQNPAKDWMPSWSPDGSQIAFVSNRSGQEVIYVMNADGSNIRQLTEGANTDSWPNWSPDGQHIAFIRANRPDDTHPYSVYVMNTGGSNQRELTKGAEVPSPLSWSPESSRISVAISSEEKNFDVRIIDVNSGDVQTLVPDGVPSQVWPSWSSDGQRLAVMSYSGAGWPRISTMNVDGLDARTPSMAPEMQSFPDWSPQGRELLFVGQERGAQGIYVANMDGASTRLVTATDGARYLWPVWSSDARQIAFVQTKSSNNDKVQDIFQLMTVNADGSSLTSLTSDLVTDSFALPAWRPMPPSTPADEDSTPTRIPGATVETFEPPSSISDPTVVPKESTRDPDLPSAPEDAETAIALAREFLDDPDNELKAERVESSSGDVTYRVTRDFGTLPHPDSLVVDIETGTIRHASITSHTTLYSPRKPVSEGRYDAWRSPMPHPSCPASTS